jgi:predicted outer membrane repeat protein
MEINKIQKGWCGRKEVVGGMRGQDMERGKRLMNCVAVVGLLAVCCAAFETRLWAGEIIYVDPNASGANDGTSWQDAYNFLQDALSDANSAPKPLEIWVAQGVYHPDRDSMSPNGTGDKKLTFRLINGVALRGGYVGLSGPDPDVRDIAVCKSIVSGDLLGDDAADPFQLDNSYCIVDGSYTDHTAVLDGFDITGGRLREGAGRSGVPWTSSTQSGGGMRNVSGSPTIVNCAFHGNNVDVYNVLDSMPVFRDCHFENHRSSPLNSYTGTMVNIASHPELIACVFEHNENGAIYTKDGDLSATGCRFSDNQKMGISGGGGAIQSQGGRLTLRGCDFSNNYAQTGGAVFAEDLSDLVVDDCIFNANEATFGGAIYVGADNFDTSACVVHISNSVFRSNSAAENRGAIALRNDFTESFSNCLFESNKANRGGTVTSTSKDLTLDGCLLLGNELTGMGPNLGYGGIALRCGTLQLINCTLDGNRAAHGLTSVIAGSASVNDCIVWDANAFETSSDHDLNIRFSDVRDGSPGQGNISIDPYFVSPGYWDPNGTPEDPNDDFWVRGDYHLKSQAGRWDPNTQSWVKDDVTSLCIDAGDPDSPIGLEPFPNGGRINMGAYGGTAEASKSYFGGLVCETIIAGDINGDCRVDMADFVILARHWLR